MALVNLNGILEDEEFMGDGIDYSDKFIFSGMIFESFEKAFDHANNVALQIGFSLVKHRYKTSDSGLKTNTCICERGSDYTSQAIVRKNTTTKKCGCKFKVIMKKGRHGNWAIFCRNGVHNHLFEVYKDGHRRLAKLCDDQKEYIKDQRYCHVPPSKVKLGLKIKFPLRVECNIRQIYNENQRLKAEISGHRNPAQTMLYLAGLKNYVQCTQANPLTSELEYIFLAHPDSVRMFRAWPYVVVIDATYGTNRYKMPLVEIIGVSPVGNSFLVAQAFVKKETFEGYTWVLQQLRSLLGDDVVPNAIVTDRELGLIASCGEVFPNSRHLLCTFHIYNNVETRALKCIKDVALSKCFVYSSFYKLLNATSEDQFHSVWEYMRTKWKRFQNLLSYVEKTWFGCKEKWCKAWTNHVCHLGNTATSRAESAHAVLKSWLRASTSGVDLFWSKAHDMIEGQHSAIRSSLRQCIGKGFGVDPKYGHLFTLLNGKVSLRAVIIMRDEYDRGVTLANRLHELCGCYLTSTHGLLCACQLHDRRVDGRRVHADEVHMFWRTLDYGPRTCFGEPLTTGLLI